jgi:hypothetical protein
MPTTLLWGESLEQARDRRFREEADAMRLMIPFDVTITSAEGIQKIDVLATDACMANVRAAEMMLLDCDKPTNFKIKVEPLGGGSVMGFACGISMPFKLDPAPGSFAALREKAACIETARREFIRQRVDELVSDSDADLAIVAHYAVIAHRTAFGEALKRLMRDGNIEAILTMDDLLRKAAEDIAQAEWQGEMQ